MYGKLVTAATEEVVIELQNMGDDGVLVIARNRHEARVIVTITKHLYENFSVMLGHDVKLIELTKKVQE